MMTRKGAFFCLTTRSEFFGNISEKSLLPSPVSPNWKVSVRTMPSKGVYCSLPIPSFIGGGGVVIGILDVDGGDVIRQKHDLIGVQFVLVFALQVFGRGSARFAGGAR